MHVNQVDPSTIANRQGWLFSNSNSRQKQTVMVACYACLCEEYHAWPCLKRRLQGRYIEQIWRSNSFRWRSGKLDHENARTRCKIAKVQCVSAIGRARPRTREKTMRDHITPRYDVVIGYDARSSFRELDHGFAVYLYTSCRRYGINPW